MSWKKEELDAHVEIQKKIVNNINTDDKFLIPRFGMGDCQNLSWLLCRVNLDFKLFCEHPYFEKFKQFVDERSGIFYDNNEDLYNYLMKNLNSFKNATCIGMLALTYMNHWKDKDAYILNYLKIEKVIDEHFITTGDVPYNKKYIINSDFPWYRRNIFHKKKILFISSHAPTMKKQWESGNVFKGHNDKNNKLPETEFIFEEMVLNTGWKDKSKYKNWKEVFEIMKDRIKNINFDIAIVSAGGYANIICDYIYTDLNKSAVNRGGDTQLLFCIRGNRWDERAKLNNGNNDLNRSFNEHWTYHKPQYEELLNVESSCYW